MDPKIKEGLCLLLEERLNDIKTAKAGDKLEKPLHIYTQKFIRTMNAVKDYLSKAEIEKYENMYEEIINL